MNVAEVLREAREAVSKARDGYTQLHVDAPDLGGVPCSRPAYAPGEMRRALVAGWGRLGGRVADYWDEYNRAYFGGRLRPLPIFLTPATPFGRRIGWTCCGGAITHIALAAPTRGTVLVADRCTLLHEMVHQHLHEKGEDFKHAGEPWRREIMRLHLALTGREIWAGKSSVGKKITEDGDRVSVRANVPHPETGEASLSQAAIARWPYGARIDLGPL